MKKLWLLATASVLMLACAPDEHATVPPIDSTEQSGESDGGLQEPLEEVSRLPGSDGSAETVIVSGKFRAPCTNNPECDNGYCIATLDGKVCSKNCTSSCGDDNKFTCAQAPGPDPVSICMPIQTPEVCDGIDNDKDFKIDEDLCEDGNPCTFDECNLGGPQGSCKHTELNGNSCHDGSECTQDDKCVNGTCTGGVKIKCTDGNPCTKDDVCDAASGCTFPPQAGPCSDNDPCTGIGSDEKSVAPDICEAGVCKPGAPSHCDDHNPCTNNLCKLVGGCYFKAVADQPNGGCPKDGDPSTVEWCVAGKCSYK